MKYDVKDFDLTEKLKALTGAANWSTYDFGGKVKALNMFDGPNGLRKIEITSIQTENNGVISSKETKSATLTPTLSVIANSWSEEVAYLDGKTIADDCVEQDVDILLAPGINVKRDVLNGRNFEYFSEDPFITGKLARAYIEGVQSKGVGTSLKHYCANNFENGRTKVSSEIDERTLREIYLSAFEESLKAKPWTVMTSYNLVNGVHMDENKKLVKGVLREEFGFDGLVVSDWNAITYHPNAIKAGVDLRMPYTKLAIEQLNQGLEKGEITEKDVDEHIEKLFELVEKRENTQRKPPEWTKEQRHQNAVELAKECFVLVKNEQSTLPLDKNDKITVLGAQNWTPVYSGGGSAHATTDFKTRILSDILSEDYGIKTNAVDVIYGESLNLFDDERKAYESAYNSDKTIICVGEHYSFVREGFDRTTIKLTPCQERLILRTAEHCDNVIVLLYASGVIDMSAWIDKVKSVVFVGFAGEGVQEALASMLVGQTVPSGKLTETFPLRIEDTLTKGKSNDGRCEWYKEGLFVGYRHYDKEKLDVLFPFGHGLSYAKFEYSNLQLEKKGETEYVVIYDITNISNVDAKEVSQVYVKDVFASVVRPEKELKGFSKDLIKAGETKRVKVELNYRSFAFYSTARDKWLVENGAFEILVGASSRDIKLKQKIEINI